MKCVLLSLSLLVAVALPAEAGLRRSRCRTCRPSGNCAVVNVVENNSIVRHESAVVSASPQEFYSSEVVVAPRESYTSEVVAQPRLFPSCKDGKCALRRQ